MNFYCVDAAGRAGGAAIWSGGKYVVGDADGVRKLEAAWLYKRDA